MPADSNGALIQVSRKPLNDLGILLLGCSTRLPLSAKDHTAFSTFSRRAYCADADH